MSILIKGMGMPESCEDCSAQIIDPTGGASGCAVNHSIILRKRGEERPAECPLVEVPKHGRLIDGDALRAKMYHEAFETDSELQRWDSGCWVRYKMFENHMDNAPTVIEAEGGE